jgi:hypothetical protein
MARLRIAAYRHYLGAWNAAERVRVHDRAPDDGELAALGARDVIGDAALAASDDAVALAMTVPARVRKKLWELDWDEAMAPTDAAAFEAYGRSVAAFFRAAGFVLGETFETRLVAGAPGKAAVDDLALHATRAVALVNVGEGDVLVTLKGSVAGAEAEVSLRVPPDEACLLSPKARPYAVMIPAEAEFGLLLELA